MAEYIPSPIKWVADQVELYEGSGGVDGITLRDTGMPVIIVTNKGWKTGAIRKTPLMRVVDGDNYIFNEAWQDTVFLACFTLVMLCILIVPLFFITRTKFGRRLIYGKEAERIYRVRQSRHTVVKITNSNSGSGEGFLL